MKQIYGLALVAALAIVPLSVDAQTPRGAERAQQSVRMQGQAPLALLLEQRAELGLTAEQVSRLEAIQEEVRQKNAPLMDQMRASGAFPGGQRMRQRAEAMTPEQRGAMREQMRERRAAGAAGQRAERGRPMQGQRQLPEELRPLMQQIQQNNRAALEQVRAVLTVEQQARARQLVEQRRGEPRGTRGSGGSR